MKELGLPWTILKVVTTGGAPSMTENRKDFLLCFLPLLQFSEVCKLAQNLANVFGSTYTHEKVFFFFSHMKQNNGSSIHE
jgi:hypothetical protein